MLFFTLVTFAFFVYFCPKTHLAQTQLLISQEFVLILFHFFLIFYTSGNGKRNDIIKTVQLKRAETALKMLGVGEGKSSIQHLSRTSVSRDSNNLAIRY